MTYLIKLPVEAKAKWVAALREPDRRQVQEHLQTNEGQCCLGVACEVIGHGIKSVGEEGLQGIIVFRSLMSNNVGEPEADDFDTDISNALFQRTASLTPVVQLVDMNDAQGNDFNQIADWIEENL